MIGEQYALINEKNDESDKYHKHMHYPTKKWKLILWQASMLQSTNK